MRYQQVLTKVIGKRVIGVISADSPDYPQSRLFLSFDDNTYLELYGAEIKVASGPDKGTVCDVLKYAKKQKNISIDGVKLVTNIENIVSSDNPFS
jgi:hypothetical protein